MEHGKRTMVRFSCALIAGMTQRPDWRAFGEIIGVQAPRRPHHRLRGP